MKLFLAGHTLQVVKLASIRLLEPYDRVLDQPEVAKDLLQGRVLWLNPSGHALAGILDAMLAGGLSGLKSLCCASRAHKALRAVVRSRFRVVRAAGGVVEKDSDVLLIYRLGCWDLPKGKCKRRERLRQTAVREIEEECGVEVRCLDKLTTTYHLLPFVGKHPALKKTTWYRMALIDDTNLAPQTNEGIEQVMWATWEDAQIRLLDSYPSIQEVMRQLQLRRAY